MDTEFAARRPRDVWRRLRFLIDQARAWADSQQGGLRGYLAWAALQESDHARVAEAVLPETDDDSVRIMTVHASKGMEFPIVIASGLSSQPMNQRGAVQDLWGDPIQVKLGKDVHTEEWESLRAVDELMGFHERIRLLYVAMTRARDHLVVSLHRAKDRGFTRTASAAELLAHGSTGSSWAVDLEPRPTALPPGGQTEGEDLLTEEEWQADHAAVAAQSRWRRTVSATDGGDLVPAAGDTLDLADDGVEAGLVKVQQDIELPPWLKGRYGSAVGRAVHGALQVIDLSSGEGVEGAVAAQCLAEAIPEREDTVRALVEMALASPLVQEAAAARHWRETYVAVPLNGGQVLEGYIDLLFERDDELVVVDYKVAAGNADLDARTAIYATQASAYVNAVQRSTGRQASATLLYLTPNGAVSKNVVTATG